MENSGLIKKEDLLKELCSFCKSSYDGHCPHPYGTCNEYEIILQFKEIPTINVAAHWTFKEEDYPLLEEGGIPYNMWCSNCGSWHSNEDYEDKYCSCCGAKMDETHIEELKGVYSNE